MPEFNDLILNRSDEEYLMMSEIALVKNMLTFCMNKQGAKITITVEHDCGNRVTANLYDHAALVQSLYDTLAYFETEL